MRGDELGGTIRSTFELPSHRESRFWLAAGLLLPVWDRLPLENMRVHQFTADDGKALIGRVLDAEQVRAAHARFGLDGGPAMTGEEAYEAALGHGTALTLAKCWRLARRRIVDAYRVQIEGPADTGVSVLNRIGCTVEIVSWAPAPSPPRHKRSTASSNAGRSPPDLRPRHACD